MKCFGLVVLLLFLPLSAFGQQPIDTLIVGGHVFQDGQFEKNTAVGVKDGRFVIIGDDHSKLTAGQTVKLDDDQFILPGLIDCHAHYNVRLIRKRREEFQYMPILYLANGVTVTFSCGEFDPESMYKLRQRIEKGDQVGPRLLTSGPYFGNARPGWRNPKPEQEIRDEVDFWAKRGVGGFKAKSIDPASLKILIDQAHKHGLTVTGHLGSGYGSSVNPRDAVSMGIDRIEHFLGGDAMPATSRAYSSLGNIRSGTPEFSAITQHFIDHKTYFDATLTAYGYFGSKLQEEYDYWIDERQFFTPHMQEVAKNKRPMRGMKVFQEIYQAKQKTIADFHKAGGTITMGTDHVSNGNHIAGFGVHREMDAFSRSGIPNSEVIKIATINGARAFGIEKDHGSIEVGKIADLFIVEGNPLENIRHTRNVQKVMRAGKMHDAKELLDGVKGKLGPANQEEEKDW